MGSVNLATTTSGNHYMSVLNEPPAPARVSEITILRQPGGIYHNCFRNGDRADF